MCGFTVRDKGGCMKGLRGLWGRMIPLVAFLVLFVGVVSAHAWTVSGTVTNNSGSTGRVYVVLVDQNNTGNDPVYGTSVGPLAASGSAPFSIKGVSGGTFAPAAFLDRTGTGMHHANDPANMISPVTVSGSDVAAGTITLSDMPSVAPTTAFSSNVSILPGTGGAVLIITHEIDPATGGIIADSYGVNCNSGAITRTVSVSNLDKKNAMLIIGGLAPGSTLSCTVTPYVGTTPSTYTGSASATIGDTCNVSGSCATGATVTGRVDLSAFTPAELAGKTLAVALSDWSNNPPYVWAVQSPSTSQTFTIPGVAANPRAYRTDLFLLDSSTNIPSTPFYLLSEKNEEARLVVESAQPVTAPDQKIPKRDSYISVNTVAQYNQGNMSPSYGLTFKYGDCGKRAVSIQLANGTTGAALPTEGVSFTGSGELFVNAATKPQAGDDYTATITYADGTSTPQTVKVVKGTIDDFLGQSFPAGNVTIPAADLSSPMLGWHYSLPQTIIPYTVSSSTANGGYNENYTSATNWLKPTLSGPLSVGGTYWVSTQFDDILGDSLRYNGSYTLASSGPVISSFSPPTGAVGTVTINGSGFTGTMGVTFNGVPASFSVVNDTQITATIPWGAARGPITVTDGSGTTTASSTPFERTYTLSGNLVNSSNIGLDGIALRTIGTGAPVTATSTSTGSYSLSPISAGVPHVVNFHDTTHTYLDVYTRFMTNTETTSGQNYIMFSTADLSNFSAIDASFGAVSAGTTGMIAGKVMDTSTTPTPLSGAVLVVYSKNYASSIVPYKVIYGNTSGVPDTTLTSTTSSGRFFVTGIEQGDMVILEATATGYQFSPTMYQVYNGAVSEGPVLGAQMPTITLSPSSGSTLASGSTVTVTWSPAVNGTLFYTTDGSDPRLGGNTISTSGSTITLTSPFATTINVRYVFRSGAGIYGSDGSASYNITTTDPAITSFSPTTVLPGDTVTITGVNFNTTPGNNTVSFSGGVSAPAATATATQLTVVVPANAFSGPLQVTDTSTGKTSQPSATQLTVLQMMNVSGQVKDASTLSGISGVTVTATYTVNGTPHSGSVSTDSYGNYGNSVPFLSVPQNTDFTLSFSATGTYAPAYTGTLNNINWYNMTLYQTATFNAWNGNDTTTGVIRGQVIDQSNSTGVSGARITAPTGYTVMYDDGSGNLVVDTGTTTTAANGVFYITHVADGASVSLSATKANYIFTTVTAVGHAGAITSEQISGTHLINVSGSVVNSSNAAVSSATVELLNFANSVTSDASGLFTISNVPGSGFELKLSQGTTFTPTYTGWLSSSADLPLPPYILFTPAEVSGYLGATTTGGAVIGRLINSANPTVPLSGGTVTVSGPSPNYVVRYYDSATKQFTGTTATDASGLFLVSDVTDNGNIYISASIGTGGNGWLNVTTHAPGVSEVAVPCTLPTIGVNGQVTDATTFSGIQNATVAVNSLPSISANTDAFGNYSLNNVPSGTDFSLVFTATGFDTAYSATFNSTSYLNVNMGLFPSGTFSAWNGGITTTGVIRGQVVDQSSSGISGARITAPVGYTVMYDDGSGNMVADTGTTTTAANGVFYLTGVADGASVSLSATKANYVFTPVSAVGHAGAITSVKISGTPTISVTGMIIDSGNSAQVGATVTQLNTTPANSTTSTSTPTAGNFNITNIPSGANFELEMTKTGFLPTYTGPLSFAGDTTLPFSYVLFTSTDLTNLGITSGGAIIGRVVNMQNPAATISGMQVTASPYTVVYYDKAYNSGAGGFNPAAPATDASGMFLVPNVGDLAPVSIGATGYSGNVWGNTYLTTHANAVSEIAVPCSVPMISGGSTPLSPTTATVQPSQTTPTISGQVWVSWTTASAAAPGLVAQLGYGQAGTDPSTWPSAQWFNATYSSNTVNTYTYSATITAPATPGSYAYVYRYSAFGGPYTYIGTSGSFTGPAQTYNSGTLTVNSPEPTTTTLTSTPNPSTFGQGVTFTAIVSSPTAGTITGNLDLYDGTNLLVTTAFTGANTGAQVIFGSISYLSAGSHTITVVYRGDSVYGTSTSSAVNQTVNQAAPVITWPTASAIAYGQTLASSTLSGGSSTPAGTFAFTTPITAPTAGTASQSVTFTPGDTNYTTVVGSVSVTVNQATPSVTTWPTASAIIYGQTLASSTLSGGLSTPAGTFAFTTPTTAPTAGTASQSVTFTPSDTNYKTVVGNISVTVNQATPMVTTWPTASTITYSQTLASSTLSGGTASVTGSFAFTSPTTSPATGTATQSVTFTPTDTTNYKTVAGSVSVTVNQATPSVTTWPTASAITYGQTLASSTLSGGSSTPAGTFAYTTPTTAPTAGTASQSVTFTPTDTTNYTTVVGSVSVTVNQATPTVTTWPTASAITYGQTLASSTLSGGSSTPGGTYAFTTPTTAPTAGTASQSVTFTPSDTNYKTVVGSISVTVNQATPSITTWPTASAIIYGQTLASSTLSGGSSTPTGTFAFTTPITAPTAGTANQSVTFTPSDTNYKTVVGNISVTVNQATPSVTTWPTASTITYGQTLASSTMTGGTASVAGIFAFTTPTTSPVTGTANQSVTFTPGDTNYKTVVGSVSVTVNQSTPSVTTWPTASAITFGQTLASSTLTGGTALVAGTFTFTTPTTVPNAGTYSASVTFTPTDTTNYTTVVGSASVTVNKATPVITWVTPAAITYGTALSATQLNATTSVPGVFVSTPASGAVLAVGTQQLSAAFTPTDTANYNNATATVSIAVTQKPLTITGITAASKQYDGTMTATLSGTGSLVGVVGTDVVSLSGTATGTFSDKNVGTGKTVNFSGLSLTGSAAGNYSITGTANTTANITAAPLAVIAAAQTKVYGAADPTLTYTQSGLVGGDTIAVFTGALARVAGETVAGGPYPINQGSLSAGGNYTITFTGANLTITPAPLTVTADNKVRFEKVANPAFTATYTGFVNGETASVLGGTLAITTTATSASAPGSYPVTPAGLTSGNYSLTFVPGTLTVRLIGDIAGSATGTPDGVFNVTDTLKYLHIALGLDSAPASLDGVKLAPVVGGVPALPTGASKINMGDVVAALEHLVGLW